MASNAVAVPEKIDGAVDVNVGAFKLTTTTAPINESLDRETIGQLLLENIDWNAAEERTSDRTGRPYKTTRSISWNMTDPGEKFRYQITVSVNRSEVKPIREGIGSTGKGQVQNYKLAADDMKFLEHELETARAEGDVELVEKLMTLKLTNQLQGGVNLDALIFLKNQVEKRVREHEGQ